jgi:HEPN domain-containing protein
MEKEEIEFQRCLIDFAIRSFRDVADKDYIVARMCFRDGLPSQFAWQALQAIEKYLKGILLFNEQPTNNYGHNIIKLAQRVEELGHLEFKVLDSSYDFLCYINSQGFNRYNTLESHCAGHELEQLDKTISYIRRYCQPVKKETLRQGVEGTNPDKHFNLDDGYLECCIETKVSPQAKSLLWGNKSINPDAEHTYGRLNSQETPLLHFYPKHAERLSNLVQFSKPELKIYRDLAKEQK